MRILQVVPVFSSPFGGPVTVVKSISKELAKRHDVIVYTTTALDLKHDSNPREEEIDGYRVTYFSRALKPLCYSYLFGQLNTSWGMMSAIKRNIKNFDIVHLHSWQQFPDFIVHHYATKCNVPYVLQAHGSIPRIGKKMRKLLYDATFGYSILQDASKVIALNNLEAEQYRAMGVPEEKIAIVPNGIDLSDYANLPPKGSFKSKHNIPEDKKIILYLGRIHRTKGIDFLIKAYAYLTRKIGYKDAILVIAGPNDGYLNEAKVLAKSLDLANSIIFTGFISKEDKLKALVDAEVFVTPCFYGFPVTFLEACATGTPIVTTNLGDVLEWIDGKAGYVTRPTPYDMAEAIHSIISDEELRRRLSENCVNIVKSCFSIENITSKLEKVYEKVLENRI
ncbi:MAG: glycosyltransferase [Nitrososphaerota archaeon]